VASKAVFSHGRKKSLS